MTKHSDASILAFALVAAFAFFVAGYHGGKYLAKQEDSDKRSEQSQ
ncbi:hypothetical protein I5U65_07920 [Stenotrophomonas maltophilia]|nr:hypothetical protein [Stenotrophomonas maltophilia]